MGRDHRGFASEFPPESASQGAGINPLLANIYLCYALWNHQWRRRHASGRVSIVRYADDFVMGL
jgi:hypothetical protein